MSVIYEYTVDQELPAIALTWRGRPNPANRAGPLLEFDPALWAMSVQIALKSAPLDLLATKTVGVVGYKAGDSLYDDDDVNVTIDWAGEFATLGVTKPNTDFLLKVWGTRIADGKGRLFSKNDLPVLRLSPATTA